MISEPFVHVYCNALDGCSLSREPQSLVSQNWLCIGCKRALPGSTPIDIYVEETRMPKRAMGSALLLGLVHRSFLAEFDEDAIARDLILGKVFHEDGRFASDWYTIRSRRRVIVRGSKNANYRICDCCRQVSYSAMGKRYLHPCPPEDCDIFESDLAGMVFRTKLVEHIDFKKYRKMQVDKLPILDPPPDGLGLLEGE